MEIKLLEGFRRAETGFGLGTPDLATASKLVAGEHDLRPPGLRPGRKAQERRGGEDESAGDRRPPSKHVFASSTAGIAVAAESHGRPPR
ncbi:MAG: hypothetical protein IPK81_08685 [Rhodospirillales bacterium]|nr:MAG: hypothetical protein IPK81_08685 [Rhodospirillales bacterium]